MHAGGPSNRIVIPKNFTGCASASYRPVMRGCRGLRLTDRAIGLRSFSGYQLALVSLRSSGNFLAGEERGEERCARLGGRWEVLGLRVLLCGWVLRSCDRNIV